MGAIAKTDTRPVELTPGWVHLQKCLAGEAEVADSKQDNFSAIYQYALKIKGLMSEGYADLTLINLIQSEWGCNRNYALSMLTSIKNAVDMPRMRLQRLAEDVRKNYRLATQIGDLKAANTALKTLAGLEKQIAEMEDKGQLRSEKTVQIFVGYFPEHLVNDLPDDKALLAQIEEELRRPK